MNATTLHFITRAAAKHTLISLAAGGLLLGSLMSAPLALADGGPDLHSAETGPSAPPAAFNAFNETATSTSYTQGAMTTDPAGNRFYAGSVYSGNVSGSPINGTFGFTANFSYPAGSASGSFDGTFADVDAAGNTIFGDLAGGILFDASGNATDSGTFVIRGGTGIYAGAAGRGRFSGTVTNSGQTATTTFTGRWRIAPTVDEPPGRVKDRDQRPGRGLRDRNHTHDGPPGRD
ncbi:MAG: hypothetical protein ACYDAG_11385 [Chloroflexota bacterium]